MGCSFCQPNDEPRPVTRASVEARPPSVEIDGQSSILHDSEMFKLIRCCPAEVKFWPWKRIYQMTEDGNSLTTFHERTKKRKQTLMIIQTTENQIFGAFANQPWIPHNSEEGYGDRQTFVWNLRELQPKKQVKNKKGGGKKGTFGGRSTFGGSQKSGGRSTIGAGSTRSRGRNKRNQARRDRMD